MRAPNKDSPMPNGRAVFLKILKIAEKSVSVGLG